MRGQRAADAVHAQLARQTPVKRLLDGRINAPAADGAAKAKNDGGGKGQEKQPRGTEAAEATEATASLQPMSAANFRQRKKITVSQV